MNKKITILGLGFLLLLCLAAPVIAESPRKIPVTFSTSPAVTDDTGARKVINPDGTKHVWGAVRTATAYLKIGSGPVLTGSIHVDLDFIIYPDLTTTQHYHKMTITFLTSNNPSLTEDGVLEGVLTWKAQLTTTPPFMDPATFESHVTWQGSGAFEGYTVHMDRDPEKGTVAWALIH